MRKCHRRCEHMLQQQAAGEARLEVEVVRPQRALQQDDGSLRVAQRLGAGVGQWLRE